MPATEAAFRINADELASGDDAEDFSAVLRRLEKFASTAAFAASDSELLTGCFKGQNAGSD
jgi:hypothetical protein